MATEGNGITLAAYEDWKQRIRELEQENQHAFLTRDLVRLDALWSDELLVNSPINRVNDKRTVLALLESGTIAHALLESEIERIERRADLVVVMGREKVVNAPGSPPFARRFTNVWREEAGAWRLLLRHANIVAVPAA